MSQDRDVCEHFAPKNQPCPRCGNQNPADIHTCTPLALKLAQMLDDTHQHPVTAAELRRMHEENEALRSDPAYDYCHRLAIMLECMTLDADKNWDAACALLDKYNAARDRWAEAQGQPYVSPFGKD